MTAIFCGSREWADKAAIERVMRQLAPDVVVHGCCRGADRLTDEVAKALGIKIIPKPADWDTHGKKAGPIRNQQMLDECKPDYVVAFGDGRGTEDMLRRARAAGVNIVRYWGKDG